LGLSREEFFLLQARQLNALVRQERYRVEERELLFAQVTAATINFSMFRPEQHVRIDSLMPSQMLRKPKKVRRRGLTKLEKAQQVMEWRKVFDIVMAAKERGETI
jgi:hypothetical protein